MIMAEQINAASLGRDRRDVGHFTCRPWLVRLFGYDGLLPACVFLCPAALALLFQGWVIEFTAVALPIIAFLYRVIVGLQLIEQNTCDQLIRLLQKTALFFGLLVLLLVDAFMILAWSMPAEALTFHDYQIMVLMYIIYLFLMAFASFPGITTQYMKG
jgi:hypothetical protein